MMKDIRNAIEEGIIAQQGVTSLEEVFAEIERDFWQECPALRSGPLVETGE